MKKAKYMTALSTGIVPGLELVVCDLEEVATDYENVRSGDVTDDGGDDGSPEQTFEDLVESIKSKGQKQPVILRPHPSPKGKVKYQLIAGYRRYAALNTLQNSTNVKHQIMGVVKPLDDLAALIENMTENQRRKLRPADLMMGLWRIKIGSEAKGETLNNTQIGNIAGCNKSHAYELLAIVEKAPKVARKWYEAQYQMGVRELRSIIKIEGEKEQLAAYEEKLKTLVPPRDGGEGPDPNAWIERSIKQAEGIATTLGHLERRGAWKKFQMNWEEELEWLGVKVKNGATKKQRNRIAAKAEKAYQAALAYVEEPEAEEGTENAA